MRLACQEHLLPGRDLLERWDFAQGAGFAGLELLGREDFRERRSELLAAAQAGVVMPTVCVQAKGFIGDFDPEKRRAAVAQMKDLLSLIAEVGGRGAVTPAAYGMFSQRLPPFTPPREPEEDRAVLLDGLAELGDHAGREGVAVLLEPLNRYEDHMVNTLEQAVELCEAVGLDSVRAMGDTYHMNIEEADLAASVRRAGRWLAHVHLSDSNRLEPGAGHLDFGSVLDALRGVGFDGFMALECRLSGEAQEVLPASAAFLRSLETEAR